MELRNDKIEEHQKVETTNPGSYTPTDKERRIMRKIDKLFTAAKKHRSKYDAKWLDYYKFFRGQQWPTSRPSYMHSEVFNFTFQAIQSQVPILMDRQPRVDYVPVEPQDTELANILSDLLSYDWKKNNWNMTIIELLYDAHIYGTGYACLKGMVERGRGKIEFESEDVFYCFPDPESVDVNKKGDHFIIAKPISVAKAKRKYKKSDNAQFIKPDLIDLTGGDKTDLGKARFQSPLDKKSAIEESRESSKEDDEKMALELIVYLRDDAVIEEKKKGKYIQKKEYPRGRRVVQVGGVIVVDEEYPYDDFEDRFAPYARLQNYVLPREFFGISEIEQIEGPQKVFNKIISFVLDVLTLMGNPVWIVDTNAGIDTDGLNNRPGLIVEKERGSEVRRESGAQLQPYVLAILDRVQGYVNDLVGSSDVSRGVKPEGIQAASAIRALQDASQTRLRLKGQLIDMFLQDIGQMYQSRVFQFYDVPYIFRITNEGSANQYFKMSVEPKIEVDEEGNEIEGEGYSVRVSELAKVGDQQVERDEKVYETKGRFDVMSSIGSGLPFAKAERATNAYNLFDRQIIDAEAVLDDIDYPNKEKVLARKKEQEEAQLEQALQAQAAQGAVPQGVA